MQHVPGGQQLTPHITPDVHLCGCLVVLGAAARALRPATSVIAPATELPAINFSMFRRDGDVERVLVS